MSGVVPPPPGGPRHGEDPPVLRGFLEEPALVRDLPARSGDGRGFLRRGRDLVLGTERRLGLWIVPLFLMMGLLGATLAGSLAVLYYGQQVRDLERSTSGARAQVEELASELAETAEGAQRGIDEQVERVRGLLAQQPPIGSPNEAGVYAVAARHPGGEVRVGSTFVIASDSAETILVTTYAVVATDDGFAVRTADVYLPDQTVTASVHNYDRDLDIATLRLRGGPLPVPQWRPGDQRLSRGDVIYAAGIAGPGTPVITRGAIAGLSANTIVPDLDLNAFIAGGPLLDAAGQVVAITSLEYRPFGPSDGDLTYAVPIRAICKRLVRCTRADLAAGELGEEGGSGTTRRPPARPDPQEEPPPPSPSPTVSPTGSPGTPPAEPGQDGDGGQP